MSSTIVTVERLDARPAAFKADFTSEIREIMNKRFDEFFTKLGNRGKIALEEDSKYVAHNDAKDSEENPNTNTTTNPKVTAKSSTKNLNSQNPIDSQEEETQKKVEESREVDNSSCIQLDKLNGEESRYVVDKLVVANQMIKEILEEERYIDPVWSRFEKKIGKPIFMFFDYVIAKVVVKLVSKLS